MYDVYSSAKADAWRFSLGKAGANNLIVIGLNPSTATQEKSDTTIAKVEHVAKMNKFGGFIMLNLYPVRATDWSKLPEMPDVDAFSENLRQIESVVAVEQGPTIWAAWGQDIAGRKYFGLAAKELFALLSAHGAVWSHYGALTKTGHPRHPSRISYQWPFNPFNMQAYAAQLA